MTKSQSTTLPGELVTSVNNTGWPTIAGSGFMIRVSACVMLDKEIQKRGTKRDAILRPCRDMDYLPCIVSGADNGVARIIARAKRLRGECRAFIINSDYVLEKTFLNLP